MASNRKSIKKQPSKIPQQTKVISKAKDKKNASNKTKSRITKLAANSKKTENLYQDLLKAGFTVSGSVATFGCGDVGQLGLGSDVLEKRKPCVVGELGSSVSDIAAGGMHTLIINKDGQLYSWGCNDEGALGHETKEEEDCFIPKMVPLKHNIAQVTAGDSHTAALTNNGMLFFWGLFRDSNGTMTSLIKTPTLLLPHIPCKMIASGSNHLVLITSDGRVFTSGAAEQGQLGRISTYFSIRGGRKGIDHLFTPGLVHVKGRSPNSSVSFDACWAGAFSSYIKEKNSNNVYTFGLNNYGQLGLLDRDLVMFPTKSEALSNFSWKKVVGGLHHTLCLSDEGKVYSLGRKEYGRLGLGENCDDASSPTLVRTLESVTCTDIGCGECVSFAITKNGDLFSWGMGTNNQLGTGDEDSFVPTKVTSKVLESSNAVRIDAGGQHSVALVTQKEI